MQYPVKFTVDRPSELRSIAMMRSLIKTPVVQAELDRWQTMSQESACGAILFGTGLMSRPLQKAAAYFDEQARLHATISSTDLGSFESAWVRARMLELLSATQHPRYCQFCYRTAWIDPNGRQTKLCRHHAQSGPHKTTAGYQRGLTYKASFHARLPIQSETDRYTEVAWEFATRCLHTHYKEAAMGREDIYHVIVDSMSPVSDYLHLEDGTSPFQPEHRDFARWRDELPPIPTYRDAGTAWRQQHDDRDGSLWLESADHCITPLLIYEQWVRYIAWRDAGDYHAPKAKGRPLKITPATAIQMRADGKTVSQIAAYLNVAEITVKQFFARQRKPKLPNK